MKKKKTLNAARLSRLYYGNVEIIVINGEAYACDDNSWNGEMWSSAWQVNEKDCTICNECEIWSRCEEVKRGEVPEEILKILESEVLGLDDYGDWVQDVSKFPEEVSYMRSRTEAGDYRYFKHFYEIGY